MWGREERATSALLFSWHVSGLPHKQHQSCKPAVFLLPRAMTELKGRYMWLRAGGHSLCATPKPSYSQISRCPLEQCPWTRAQQLL